jgi:carbon storage regulator
MLVLSRKPNQSIMIGSEVRVVVVGFDGDQVKLGIEAPRDVPVHRCEIYEQIRREQAHGTGGDPGPVGKKTAGADTYLLPERNSS